MKKTLVVIVSLLVLVAGWFFISPLFIDEEVNEEFDYVLESGALDMDAVMAIPEEKRLAMKLDIMATAASAPDADAEEAMPADGPVVIASGQLVDADAVHKGNGQAVALLLISRRISQVHQR